MALEVSKVIDKWWHYVCITLWTFQLIMCKHHTHKKTFICTWKNFQHMVLHLLTVSQEHIRMNFSQEWVEMFKCNPTKVLWRHLTADETIIPLHEWKCSKEGKDCSTSWKADSNCFWDSRGVVFIHYLGKGKTICRELTHSAAGATEQC